MRPHRHWHASHPPSPEGEVWKLPRAPPLPPASDQRRRHFCPTSLVLRPAPTCPSHVQLVPSTRAILLSNCVAVSPQLLPAFSLFQNPSSSTFKTDPESEPSSPLLGSASLLLDPVHAGGAREMPAGRVGSASSVHPLGAPSPSLLLPARLTQAPGPLHSYSPLKFRLTPSSPSKSLIRCHCYGPHVCVPHIPY